MCLVGRWRERENSWGPTIFSLGPPNYNLSKIERKQERNFCACEKNIWSLVLRYSFFLFFFLLHSTYFLYSLWTSFHLLLFFFFLVSSCFPFYASIFFSFFFTSFLFLFLFFLKIYLLASASSFCFYLLFFLFFF